MYYNSIKPFLDKAKATPGIRLVSIGFLQFFNISTSPTSRIFPRLYILLFSVQNY